MGDEHKNLDGVRGSGSPNPQPEAGHDVTGVDFAKRLQEEEAAARARAEAARKAAEAARLKAEAERKQREEEARLREAERLRAVAEQHKAEEERLHPHGSNRLLIILTVIGVIAVAGLAGYYFTIGPGGKPAPTPTPTPTPTPSFPPKPLPPVGPAVE